MISAGFSRLDREAASAIREYRAIGIS